MSSRIAEGTKVILRNLDTRPDFNGKEAEVGAFKDGKYECWLVEDGLDGQYVFAADENLEIPGAQEGGEGASAEGKRKSASRSRSRSKSGKKKSKKKKKKKSSSSSSSSSRSSSSS